MLRGALKESQSVINNKFKFCLYKFQLKGFHFDSFLSAFLMECSLNFLGITYFGCKGNDGNVGDVSVSWHCGKDSSLLDIAFTFHPVPYKMAI